MRDRSTLSVRQRACAFAIAETLFSKENHAEAGDEPASEVEQERQQLAQSVASMERFLEDAGSSTTRLYRVLLRVVEWVAPLLVFHLPRFTSLSAQLRAKALRRLEHSPLSAVIWGLKAILCSAYWEAEIPAREIGYDGRCMLEGVENDGRAGAGDMARAHPAGDP